MIALMLASITAWSMWTAGLLLTVSEIVMFRVVRKRLTPPVPQLFDAVAAAVVIATLAIVSGTILTWQGYRKITDKSSAVTMLSSKEMRLGPAKAQPRSVSDSASTNSSVTVNNVITTTNISVVSGYDTHTPLKQEGQPLPFTGPTVGVNIGISMINTAAAPSPRTATEVKEIEVPSEKSFGKRLLFRDRAREHKITIYCSFRSPGKLSIRDERSLAKEVDGMLDEFSSDRRHRLQSFVDDASPEEQQRFEKLLRDYLFEHYGDWLDTRRIEIADASFSVP